ncbi:hypothetical protein ABEB36_006441 [Hypothenemus hampei]|uniref:Uncharacterized protein n=1 Tax=Hypothenemus hampei TaxID=57062 RepID=A0ABD1EUF5_HYPHA
MNYFMIAVCVFFVGILVFSVGNGHPQSFDEKFRGIAKNEYAQFASVGMDSASKYYNFGTAGSESGSNFRTKRHVEKRAACNRGGPGGGFGPPPPPPSNSTS